jgi:glucose-6-phosphate 1-dehydrogenase
MSTAAGPASSETPSVRVREPFILVIFGASGDLTRRKLVPAVHNLFCEGLLPDAFAILGYGRSELDDEGFRGRMRDAVEACDGEAPNEEDWPDFARRLHYQQGDYDDPDGYRALGRRIEELAENGNLETNCLFYLATPPAAFVPVIDQLKESGLARRGAHGTGRGGSGEPGDRRPWRRIVVEKPFGRDLESARDLNRRIGEAFVERQIFRIDHYLGKETVQNIMALRFANAIFEPIWNQKFVDHVQITVSETVGVEGRGSYYDHAGALRDIVQNHMMHLLCLVAMEPPLSLEPDPVRDEKIKVLRALRPATRPADPGPVVRGQYADGRLDGRDVPGFCREDGVDESSTTETYVAMKLCIDNWRWSGVPFYLRTGKRMPVRITEIGIHFRPIPRVLFNADRVEPVQPNVLAIRIQPNEGISLRFQVKVPGPGLKIEPFQMDFSYAGAFNREPPEAYERLLLDAAAGESTLFTRSDEVEAAWALLDPFLKTWDEEAAGEIPTYPAGSWGPDEADELLAGGGREWMLVHRTKPAPCD